MASGCTVASRNILKILAIVAFMIVSTESQAGPVGECAPVPGIAQLWAKPTIRFVLIGEMHGTAETPSAFRDIVCAALSQRKHVIVGLELPQEEQPIYDSFLASQGTPADQAALLRAPSWSAGMRDGRTSVAMLDLFRKMREWVLAGAGVSLVAFQPSRLYPNPSEYEAAMSSTLLSAAQRYSDSLVIVLTGNWHASKSREIYPGSQRPYDVMAMHLPADTTINLIALSMKSGSTWACMPGAAAGDVVCGPHDLNPQTAFRGVAITSPGITLFPGTLGGYDGWLALERFTASPPAVP